MTTIGVHLRSNSRCGAPPTLRPCFAGRVIGEQTINRAELSALIQAAMSPQAILHTDSQYACNMAQEVVLGKPIGPQCANRDLLTALRAAHIDPARVRKIRAHQDLAGITDLLQLYHALGNTIVDETAKRACQDLAKPWQAELQAFHNQIQYERDLLHDVYLLYLELSTARSVAEKQLTRQEDTTLPPAAKVPDDKIMLAVANWQPDDVFAMQKPATMEWTPFFSWGSDLAMKLVAWMEQIRWVSEGQGPLEKEMGISWLELALSFSMSIQRVLPIVRKNNLGQTRLLHVEDQADVAAHSVTLNDLAATFQKMWCQVEIWITKDVLPPTKKGLQPSLFLQHFKQYTSGISPRPVIPYQREVAQFVFKFLVNTSNYDLMLDAAWSQPRTKPLQDLNWTQICDRLKTTRRTWKTWSSRKAKMVSLRSTRRNGGASRTQCSPSAAAEGGHSKQVKYYNLPRFTVSSCSHENGSV